MLLPENIEEQKAGGPPSRASLERRQFPRIAVTVLGRFMRENRHEYPCKLIDISAGGAAFIAPTEPAIGERIISYFDVFGGLEGKVVRTFGDGFAVAFVMTAHKREKMAATLESMARNGGRPSPESRRHSRLIPAMQAQTLTLGDQLTVACEIINMSISGASLATAARPPIGTEIKFGNLNARVVRHHDRGIALEFIDVQNPNALRKYFG